MSAEGKVWTLRDNLTWIDGEGRGMEFRLTWEGVLLATNSGNQFKRARKDDKHKIRQAFHPQLKRLFEITPILHSGVPEGPTLHGYTVTEFPKYDKQAIANRFTMYGFMFLPLITSDLRLTCWLDVLYLRKKRPGALFEHGDIDNRLKTLVDALSVPDANQGYEKRTQGDEELPYFHCLLENDRLVSKITVETDYLLQELPINEEHPEPNENDARLVITVRLKPYETTLLNILFA
jgi:hypothetical protein